MSLLDTLRKNLTPEQLATVQDALGDDFNYDVVPRSRLNAVIKQRDEARRQMGTPAPQGNENPDDDDKGGAGSGSNPAGAAKSFTQADVDAIKNQYMDTIADMRKRYAATVKLREANFIDPDTVLSAGLIDLKKIKLDEAGAITEGLDDQISSLAQNKPYMVAKPEGGQRGTGKQGGSEQFESVTSREEFLKLPADKQLEFKKANPEVFKSFLGN